MPKDKCALSCTFEDWDVVIVGAGLAGLYTALSLAESGKRILVLAKTDLEESNTNQAQGGIAASISEEDSPSLHLQDTLTAGAGLCDPQAVKKLVQEGRRGIHRLIEIGVIFDTNQYGLALTREGAHSKRRILHARGDATGKEIREKLSAKLGTFPNVQIRTNTFVLDLMGSKEGCSGLLGLDAGNDLFGVYAAHVVIASGGACQMYKNTTNPLVATGDGISMAWRLGAGVTDMEFVQFHPTALMLEGAPRFLISEAVRGEGALLLNKIKERFMSRYHPQAELAPRDVVSLAISREMEETESGHVWLDVSPLTIGNFSKRFPTIYKKCAQYGLELPGDLIPVAPAAHYFVGGIITDDFGKTNIPGLYACGEASCTGVHGANRLASNSLLEALVYGGRIAESIIASNRHRTSAPCFQGKLHEPLSKVQERRKELQDIVWRSAGLQRDGKTLKHGLKQLDSLKKRLPQGICLCRSSMELINMVSLAQLVVWGSLLREESRGGHYRCDFPETDQSQRGHWVFQRGCLPKFIRLGGEENLLP